MWTERETSDRLEIAAVLELYCRAIDERRFELLDEVFASDALLSYSMTPEPGPPLPYPELKKVMREFVGRFFFTQHLLGLPLIELSGDEARSTVGLQATHAERRRDGEPSTWVVYGTYRDRLARTPGGWRIVERTFTCGHTEGALGGAPPGGSGGG
jgi:hypothetical protein